MKFEISQEMVSPIVTAFEFQEDVIMCPSERSQEKRRSEGMKEEEGEGAAPVVQEYVVTLTRPPAPWRLQVKEDGVGTMIGIYAVTCDSGADARHADARDGLLGVTKFVPLDDVTLRLQVDVRAIAAANKRILIFPATFDKGKVGPFRLSAKSHTDPGFTLRPYSPSL
jgi:hypothetical protein